jgi:polysaccharide export outer membrane protein
MRGEPVVAAAGPSDGIRWRWPGTRYADATPVSGDSMVSADSGRRRWFGQRRTVAATANPPVIDGAAVTPPAAAMNPPAVPTTAPATGVRWRWPGTNFSYDNTPKASGDRAVIATAAGPSLGQPDGGGPPVIASSFRPVQRVEPAPADGAAEAPGEAPAPLNMAAVATDLPGTRPVAIATTGPAAASAPAVSGPPVPAVPTAGPAVGDVPPGEEAPAPRLVPQPQPTVIAGPVGKPLVNGFPPGLPPGPPPVPKEFAKQSLPPYVIEPPDILLVESTQSIKDQPVRGQHLVRPDGTIGLGIYGSAYVAGLTLEQARYAIGAVLAQRIKDFDVKNLNVDVLAYNSKVYYVITDGGGYGEQVYRIPVTGNETVLDALGQINGLPPVASKKNIWVARATPGDGRHTHPNILPVDWCGITQRGAAATNYQVLPNDRIYVKADPWIRLDSGLAKRISPIERLLGVTLLGSTTVNSIRNGGNAGLGGGIGF